MKKILALLVFLLAAGPLSATELLLPRSFGLRYGPRPVLFARMPLFQVGTTNPGHTAGGGGITGSGTFTTARVPFASGGSTLTDDSDMTFVTDTLTVTKIVGSTSITDTGLTATRVTFAGTAGLLSDDADLTFSVDTLTATKLIGSTSITDTGLTAARVTFAGTAGLLADDADMTFATDTLTVTKVIASTNLTLGADAILSRDAAGTVQLGADVNGAPVAQTVKAHDGITGTDKIGANLTVAAGTGTGAGAGAQTSIGRDLVLATGTTQQSSVAGFTVCESKTLSNTTGTATAIANIALASNSAGAARITVSVQCDSGTNYDSDIVTSYAAFVNKATVVTVGTAVTTASAAANNSGSCTIAPTWVVNGNSIDIKVTPVISTIAPTTTRAFVNIENLGSGAVTCN